MLGDSLPSSEKLEYIVNHGMILFPGPPEPMTLGEFNRSFQRYSYMKAERGEENVWLSWPVTNEETIGPGWHAIRAEPFPDSERYTNEKDRQRFIPEGEYIPTAVELAYMIGMYHDVRTVRLLPHLYAATSSRWGRCIVTVGGFEIWGDDVNDVETTFSVNYYQPGDNSRDHVAAISGLKLVG